MRTTSKKTGRAYNADGKMSGGIYKRGDVYWIKYRHNGKTVCESSGSTRRADAVALRESKRTQSRRGSLVPDARRVTFEDLLRLLGDRPVSRRLREFFAGMRAVEIRARVRAFEDARMADGVTVSTLNADKAALRRAFNLAVEAGLVSREQAPVLKTPAPDNVRTGFFEAAELRAVLDALPPHLRGVAEFAWLTGWRVRSEVLPLTWARVDWRAGVVRLEPGTTKNGDGREFPFAALPALRALLERQLASGAPVSAHHVFHDGGRPLDYKRVRLAWRRACGRARVPGRLLHDLRRTAVRNLVRAGVPQVVAMSLTGHRTTAVFHRYAIIDTVMQREGVAKLARLADAATATEE